MAGRPDFLSRGQQGGCPHIQVATARDASSGGAGPSGCVGAGPSQEGRTRPGGQGASGAWRREAAAALSLTQPAAPAARRLGISGRQQRNSAPHSFAGWTLGEVAGHARLSGSLARPACPLAGPRLFCEGSGGPAAARPSPDVSALMRRVVSFCCHNNRPFSLLPEARPTSRPSFHRPVEPPGRGRVAEGLCLVPGGGWGRGRWSGWGQSGHL